MTIISRAALFFLATTAGIAWAKTNQEGQEYLATNLVKEGVTVTKSGLQYRVLASGPEDAPSPGPEDPCLVAYSGTLIDGTRFDSSAGTTFAPSEVRLFNCFTYHQSYLMRPIVKRIEAEPRATSPGSARDRKHTLYLPWLLPSGMPGDVTLIHGARPNQSALANLETRRCKVISGWTEAMQMMREGDEWEVTLPSELAYGDTGAAGGRIPKGAVLIFRLKLIEVGEAQSFTSAIMVGLSILVVAGFLGVLALIQRSKEERRRVRYKAVSTVDKI